MQIYPIEPSFIATQSFTVGVQPQSMFGIAVYRQDTGEALTQIPKYSLATTSQVQQCGTLPNYQFFQSAGSLGPMQYGSDWSWPTVSIRLPSGAQSGIYAVVIFPVDANGAPTTSLGRTVSSGGLVTPAPPFSDSMALLVGRPAQPKGAKIAYIVPVATYHAYNGTGGGCFYGYPWTTPPIAQITSVTMRRPGGGLGALLGEPTDPYDQNSPRQQFGHWDAKFIRWMKVQQQAQLLPAADYYTDLDFHAGISGLSQYSVVVSVGHHEYWSQSMRDNLTAFLAGGGNYASFSGNTCFRPITFGAYRTPGFNTSIQKTADCWPNWSESDLIGLSYHYGAGQWGNHTSQGWQDTGRPSYGFKLSSGKYTSWVFSRTGLTDGATIGGPGDHLLGYEADGVNPTDSTVQILAQSPALTGFQDGGGKGAMIIKNDPGSGAAHGAVFNAGTTDWARILWAAGQSQMIVAVITLRVLSKFAAGQSALAEDIMPIAP